MLRPAVRRRARRDWSDARTGRSRRPADQRPESPSLRRGDEIWADRAEFAALHVDVSPDCDGSPNYINVSIKSLNMAFTGAFTSAHGYPNPVYSCADVPGTLDLVLTPDDMVALNGMLAQIDDNIRQQATARGYAYFSLGVLFERSDLKSATYSVVSQTDVTVAVWLVHVARRRPSERARSRDPRGRGWRGDQQDLRRLRRARGHAEPAVASRPMAEEPLPSVALDRAKKFLGAHTASRFRSARCPADVAVSRLLKNWTARSLRSQRTAVAVSAASATSAVRADRSLRSMTASAPG